MKIDCIICDIDGTLAHRTDRSPYDWSKVGEDTLDVNVKRVLDLFLADGVEVFLFTGRDGCCLNLTVDWLSKNGVKYDGICMREEGNQEKDSVIKKRMYEGHIKDKYNVLFVLDDRQQVVDMWRNELGLKCFQVAEGNF